MQRRLFLATTALAGLAPSFVRPALAAGEEVAIVVKIGGIPWFNALEQGVLKAGKEHDLNAYMIGPTDADPAQQVRAVEDLIAKQVAVIGVVPNDAAALEPVFARAQAAGIPVITHESPDQKGNTWNIEMIDSVKFGEAHMERKKRKPTEHLAAYDFVLRGEWHASHGDASGNPQALSMFEQALAIDPDCAPRAGANPEEAGARCAGQQHPRRRTG